jgi:hypothetical protein
MNDTSADLATGSARRARLIPIWTVLDVRSEDRGVDWCPKLEFVRKNRLNSAFPGSARHGRRSDGDAQHSPSLNPHLTKSRLNDAPRLCDTICGIPLIIVVRSAFGRGAPRVIKGKLEGEQGGIGLVQGG